MAQCTSCGNLVLHNEVHCPHCGHESADHLPLRTAIRYCGEFEWSLTAAGIIACLLASDGLAVYWTWTGRMPHPFANGWLMVGWVLTALLVVMLLISTVVPFFRTLANYLGYHLGARRAVKCTKHRYRLREGGCRTCEVCGKVAHDIHGCSCTICGEVLTDEHGWHGCRCDICGKTRDEAHSWDHCKCTVCGKLRDTEHDWDGCTCSVCGKVRDEAHAWDGCSCTICNKVRNEAHDWQDCTCTKCGKVRKSHHAFDRCRCNRCGKPAPDAEHWHDWDYCVCRLCGARRYQGQPHDWLHDFRISKSETVTMGNMGGNSCYDSEMPTEWICDKCGLIRS